MRQIQQMSSVLLYFLRGLIIFVPIMAALEWLAFSTTGEASALLQFLGMMDRSLQTPEGLAYFNKITWSPLFRALGWGIDMIGNLPFLLSLFVLNKLFAHYKRGEIFSRGNAVLYRKLGVLYILDALVFHSLSQTLMVLLVTFTNAPGHRWISLSFGTPNLAALFYGTLVVIVSWVMIEASKLQDEQWLTI